MTRLEALLRARIEAKGPLRLDAWWTLCLWHPEFGYYATRDPLGAAGDFVTAPEVSQMFGELIGLWAAQVWADQGRPDPFVFAELGPGRGTLMKDVLRAAAALPGFCEAARLWLVEASPVLRRAQAETLGDHRPRWADRIADLPDGPLVVIANEFLDALPVRQLQRTGTLWRERRVGLAKGQLAFVWGAPAGDLALDARFPLVSDGAVVEVNPAAEAVAAAIGARVAGAGGAALFVDYGAWEGAGDTLQAVRAHHRVDPLATPGEADLTAHIGFRAIAEAGRPARAWGPVPQGVFLERLGITARARTLARGAAAAAEEVAAAHRRLTHPEEMGQVFQVMALLPEDAPSPPGFDA